MHPTREELRQFVAKELDDQNKYDAIAAHVEQCELCRELCEDCRVFADALEQVSQQKLPDRAIILANKLYNQAMTGSIIPLVPISTNVTPLDVLAAADSESPDGGFKPRVVNLATMYSEAPELILRVMRDQDAEQDYLQLISDDPVLISNVLIQAPEIDGEFVTDEHGRALLEGSKLENPERLKWQIKMADAMFQLEPLVYNPDHVEYAKDVVLETDRKDKIKITFQGKTEGKQILIQILELEGNAEFGEVKVNVSQDDCSEMKNITGSQNVVFELTDKTAKINIRLFY